jgi:hypothetical protein
MKIHQRLLASIMTLVLGFVLGGFPEYCRAQQGSAPPQNGQQSGTTIDPSKGPLQPVPTPDEGDAQAPLQSTPESSTRTLPSAPSPQYQPEQPLPQPVGTATAEGVPTVGGAASRPAGEAIAPAKQNQRHSLLLKIGLIAAVGVAGGVVYALSKSSPSKPPQ